MQGDIRSGAHARSTSRQYVYRRPAVAHVDRVERQQSGSIPRKPQFQDVVVSPNKPTLTPSQQKVVISPSQSAHTLAKSQNAETYSSRKVPIRKPFQHRTTLGLLAVHGSTSRPSPLKKPRLSLWKKTRQGVRTAMQGYVMMYSAAAMIFVVGAITILQGITLNNQVQTQTQVLSAATSKKSTSSTTTTSDELPSEEKPQPSAIETYTVAADLPRVISIASIDVKARVLQVGVDSDNNLMTPKSVFDTAWYTGSAKPGEMGAAVIDGHYSGMTAKGVFARVKELKDGDNITLERGDGSQLKFVVAATETVAADSVDMAKLLVSQNPSKPGLNLITCGGKYDAATRHFEDRTIVYAVLET